MSVREDLVSMLTPVLPDGWRLVPYQRNIDVIKNVTVMLKQLSIAKLPEAPKGTWSVGFVLTIVDPHDNPVTAEAALDDNVITFFDILDALKGVNPTEATKVKFSETKTNLAYDITATITTKRNPS